MPGSMPPGRAGHFVGLDALIAKEKLAAAGFGDFARVEKMAAAAAGVWGASAQSSMQQFADAARQAAAKLIFAAPTIPTVSAPSPSGSSGGGQAPDLSAIGSSFKDAAEPLAQLGTRMEASFERVGSVVVALARRIDQSMRFASMQAGLDQVRTKLSAVAAAGAPTSGAFLKARQALAAYAGGASKAVGIFQGLLQAQSAIKAAFSGDVTKAAANGVGAIRAGFSGMLVPISAVKAGIRGVGIEIAVALGVFGLVNRGVHALAGFLKESVVGASDLNETMNRSAQVFGGSASAVTAEADRMARAFGASKDEFIGAAATFGAVFKGSGKSQADAAALGNQLTKLGMDLASFSNTSNGDAFTAISAAPRGEMQPMERFNVFLTADTVAAEALSTGLANTKGEITDTAKRMAVMSLITKQTADAQGDLSRTAGENANQWRKFSGIFTNLAAEVGAALAPFTVTMTRLGVSMAGGFAGAFQSVQPQLKAFATAAGPMLVRGMAAAADAAAVAWSGLTRLASAASGLASRAWPAIVAGASAARAQLVALWESATQLASGLASGVVESLNAAGGGLAFFRDAARLSAVSFGSLALVIRAANPFAALGTSLVALTPQLMRFAQIFEKVTLGPFVTLFSSLTKQAKQLADALFNCALWYAKFSDNQFGTKLSSGLEAAAGKARKFAADLQGGAKNVLNDAQAGGAAAGWGDQLRKVFSDMEAQAKAAEDKANAAAAANAARPVLAIGGAVGITNGLAGIGASLQSALGPMGGLGEATAKVSEAVAELTRGLKLQVQTFGMSSAEAELFKLSQEGASASTLKEASATAKQLNALQNMKKAQDDMIGSARSVWEQTRTPMEKYADEFAKLKKMHEGGMFDDETFQRGVDKAQKERDGDKGPKFANLAEIGSKEAYSAIIKAQGGQRDSSSRETAKNTAKALDLQQKQIDATNKLGSAGGIPVFAMA